MEDRIVYVGFSKHKSLWAVMSFLIRWWEEPRSWNPRTWFDLFFASHVYLIFPATKRRKFYMVSEAAGSSVRYMSQMNFEGHAEILKVYEFRFPKETYDKIRTYSEQYAGNPYALWENVGIVLGRFLRRKVNMFSGGEKYQKCSELVLRNAVLRLPEMDFVKVRGIVHDHTGYDILDDIDSIGVRDTYLILEALEAKGVIKELPSFTPLLIVS